MDLNREDRQSLRKIHKELATFGWKEKVLHLIYSASLLQKWYVKQARGVANGRSYEKKALLCWKGKFPAGLPKERQYVDVGSALYMDTMLKVPVLHPKDLTYVDKLVFEQSLASLVGVSAEAGPDVVDSVQVDETNVADSAAQLRPSKTT